MMARGFTTFVVKPSQHIDDGALLGDLCADIINQVSPLGR
jgi:hypothetical protein